MIDFSKMYSIKKEEKIFVDTNILIYLFSPYTISESQEENKEIFSKIFSKIIENKNELYINSHVISEFINQSLRLDFNRNFNQNNDKNYKKDYRNSQEYKISLKVILKQVQKICTIIKQINDDFQNIDILNDYKINSKIDFNDLIIADTVIKNKLKLLTNDFDFNGYKGININWFIPK